MPAEAATNLDTATLLKAVAFSLRYLLDPQRGAGKNLPTDAELGNQFPNSQITTSAVKNWLYNEFGSTSLEEIAKDQTKIQQELEKLERQKQVSSKGTVPKISPEIIKLAQTPKARVSALGVLAELEAIEPLLKKHQQEITPKLTDSLKPQVQSLIETLGVKDLPAEQIATLTEDIASEVTRETLETLPKIADPAQIPDVVTDSLIQTLITNPTLAPQIAKSEPAAAQPPQFDEEKLVKIVAPIAIQITKSHQSDLEKTAVLGSLSEIANLQKPSQDILDLISNNIRQTVELHAPLTPPDHQQVIQASLGTYLVTYLEELNKQLPPVSPTSLPSFENLQKIKEVAHSRATAKIATYIAQNKAVQQVGQQIGYNTLTANLGVALRLAPPKVLPQKPLSLPAGSGLIMSSDKNRSDAYLSLLTHDQDWFNKELKKTTAEVESFKKRKSLTFHERKIYLAAQTKLTRLQKAQELALKKPKRVSAFRNIFRNRLELLKATYSTQSFWEYRLDYFRPQTIVNSPRFGPRFAFATIAPGSLSFFGKINPGFRFSATSLAPSFGMGKGPQGISGLTPIGILTGSVGRWARNIAGLTLGGLAILFWSLGKAALTGFLIGAAVGGTTGAILGAVLPIAAFGPAGILLWPVTIPLGFFAGASIFGTAGGLIGLGLASGSTTAIATGIGAGVGGTTGAVIGGILGAPLGPLGIFGGAVIGGYVGAIIGGALGYLFGHYVIGTLGVPASGALIGATIGFYLGGPVGSLIGAGIGWLATGGWVQIKNFFAGTTGVATGAAGGVIGAIGGFFTSAASAIWGGITAAAGGALGFLSGAANFVVGGLSTLSIPASAAMIPVAGGIGAVAIGGTIVGIVTATSFFNLETDIPSQIKTPGENQFFTLSKTSNPQKLDNNDLPHDITFNITLTAKETKLTNIQVTDQLKVQTKSNDFLVTLDKNDKPISPPCADKIPTELEPKQNWDCQFVIVADKNPPERNFSDSFVANTVTVTTTPEGKTAITDSAVATVVIGNPPTICAIFEIQGPWSNEEKKSIDEVCKTLDRSPKIVSLLQKAGTIFLIRVADGSLGSGVCGTVNGANTISISCNMANVVFAKYVIIHELGHVLGNYNGAAYNAFIGVYNQEGLMPTYPFAAGGSSESFAEMITDFVISKSYNYPPRSWSNYPGGPWDFSPSQNGYTSFKNDRPAHYNFAKTEIFGGVEY